MEVDDVYDDEYEFLDESAESSEYSESDLSDWKENSQETPAREISRASRAKPEKKFAGVVKTVQAKKSSEGSKMSNNKGNSKKSKEKSSAKTQKTLTSSSMMSPISFLNASDIQSDISFMETPQVSKDGKTIEETYKKLTLLEQILLRPDTYVGSTDMQETDMWVLNSEESKMEFRKISYVPALYKIFDEILVNAADHFQRDRKMKRIDVEIDKENGLISVRNDGNGIPITKHKKENLYIPEMVFGHLLTGSNYDDDMKKVTGGRNGYGAKLCNIFSTHFTLETADIDRKKIFKQRFYENMKKSDKPKLAPYKKVNGYTKVEFKPDLGKFGMSELSDDIVSLFKKRVYDVAGCNAKLNVYLNGKKLPIRTFKDYVKLYIDEEKPKDFPVIYKSCGERWEIAFTVSEGQFQQVSFVNSISTINGGRHVDHVAQKIVAHLRSHIEKKHKRMKIRPYQIQSHIWLFVRSLIENPAFDSQTKEKLTSLQRTFGSTCDIPADFLKSVTNSGVMDRIVQWSKFKEETELKRQDGARKIRITGIPKLDDANKAGGVNGKDCTLILTEGDSAKALAVSGLGVVGRDKYGVFPLRGKLLNVRDAPHSKITNNEEIQNIRKILGLQHKKSYENSKSLRYGHVMIMTDQDPDGSHIKGLIINFFHYYWPSLLEIPGFVREFVTPIVKATKNKQEKSFFTLPDFEEWKEKNNDGKGWKIKYYKGLGTSSSKEAKEYFSNIEKHQIDFAHEGTVCDDKINLAFNKKMSNERKNWLLGFDEKVCIDHDTETISYNEFVDKELIQFSNMDNTRSIPSALDGLKPGQRKVLFSCFKRNLHTEVKVAQLAGYVAEHSAYHHGEQSLSATIVSMAHSFVGSNNINLLTPSGQFGTRLQGGKDSASARYIYTYLTQMARALFKKEDDHTLDFMNEDGLDIEPKYYLPILPMVLINGAEGIGTGWSTFLPNFNPDDIIRNIYNLMEGKDVEPMKPWYRGFTGQILPNEKSGGWNTYGSYEKLDGNKIRITELPIRSWTQQYKEFLEHLMGNNTKKDKDESGEKVKTKAPSIKLKDYKENHTDTEVKFTLHFDDTNMKLVLEKGIEKVLKLTSSLSGSNVHLYNEDGRIVKYNDPESILTVFYEKRLSAYADRKLWLIENLESILEILENKMRFIVEVIEGKVKINNVRKDKIYETLRARNYFESDDTFDYLLKMPMWSLTYEKVEELREKLQTMTAELENVIAKSEKEMWRDDIVEFQAIFSEYEEERISNESSVPKKKKGGASRKRSKKSRKDDFESDFSSSDEWTPKSMRKQESQAQSQDASPSKSQPMRGVRGKAKQTVLLSEMRDELQDEEKLEVVAKHAISPSSHVDTKPAPMGRQRIQTKLPISELKKPKITKDALPMRRKRKAFESDDSFSLDDSEGSFIEDDLGDLGRIKRPKTTLQTKNAVLEDSDSDDYDEFQDDVGAQIIPLSQRILG